MQAGRWYVSLGDVVIQGLAGCTVVVMLLCGCTRSIVPPSLVAERYQGPIESRDVVEGGRIYITLCTACHDGRVNARGYHWSPGQMRQQIREGNRLMPPLSRELLSDEHVEAVLAYLSVIHAIDGPLPERPHVEPEVETEVEDDVDGDIDESVDEDTDEDDELGDEDVDEDTDDVDEDTDEHDEDVDERGPGTDEEELPEQEAGGELDSPR